jgi:hypothetical protein
MLPYYYLLAILLSTRRFAKPVRTVVLAILTANSPHSCPNLPVSHRHIESRKRLSIKYADFILKDPSVPLKTPISATFVYDTRTKAPQLSSGYPSSTPHLDTP